MKLKFKKFVFYTVPSIIVLLLVAGFISAVLTLVIMTAIVTSSIVFQNAGKYILTTIIVGVASMIVVTIICLRSYFKNSKLIEPGQTELR